MIVKINMTEEMIRTGVMGMSKPLPTQSVYLTIPETFLIDPDRILLRCNWRNITADKVRMDGLQHFVSNATEFHAIWEEKEKNVPFFAIGNDELAALPKISTTGRCPYCEKKHPVSHSEDGHLSSVFCPISGKTYLVGVEGKEWLP